MNWAAINFDWTHVRAFLCTAEEGSLSAAARALGQTQPTLGRQISAFEDRLGVTLFERSGRSLRLTAAGRDLLEPARAMRDAALRFSLVADGQSSSIAGRVSITATEFVASRTLPPILAQLRQVAPALEIDVIASNEVQDLTRREADISIRHSRPDQPDLIARLVRETHGNLYAAATYLDRVGRPTTLDEAARCEFIGFDDVDRMLPVLASFGLKLSRDAVRLSSQSGEVIARLTREGLGYSVLSEGMARDTGGLERVLEEVFTIPIPVWLVTHSELHTARRIRLVFDHLAEHLSRPTALI